MSLKNFCCRTTLMNDQQVPVAVVLLSLSTLISGCATSGSKTAEAPPPAPPVIEEVVIEEPEPVVEEIATNQLLHFEAQGVAFMEAPQRAAEARAAQQKSVVQAEGFGLPSPSAENSAQKRLTATEAAQYRALANLSEKLTGIEVTREARTVDMAFAGEEVQVSLSGTLSGISEVSRNYDEATEIATVTLQVALDAEDDPEHMAFEQALSVEHRKVRAIAAARMQATASMREQIGQIYVEQDILVEDFMVTHQVTRVYVQGLLEGILFSDPQWLSEVSCEVTATLEVNKTELDRIVMNTPDGPSPKQTDAPEGQ